MEDVLDVYELPFDEKRPVVCLDETCKEIHGDARPSLPAKPAQAGKLPTPHRKDYEYVRNGSVSIFMVYEPLTGRCHVESSEQRTARDYARIVKYICDVMYPTAEKILLVQDNLNTHAISSLYNAFPPQEAHRLAGRLQLHYTPKHGSWLNMAEIALRLLCTQCISQRFPTRAKLKSALAAWQKRIGQNPMRTDWRFKTRDARIKLKRLYPVLEAGPTAKT